jgi:flavin reductase ActVB
MAPPLVLVCIGNKADSHPAFLAATRYSINILAQDQQAIAMRFARKGVDKFGSHEFHYGTEDDPPAPILPGSMASLVCTARDVYEAGDHPVLIGEIEQVELGNATPLVY